MANLYEKNGVLLLDDNGTSLRGCCCCPYESCDSMESHAASTVEWCAATIGCAQSYPHEVYADVSGGGGLFDPAQSYFYCSGRTQRVMDKSSRCCSDQGNPRYPLVSISTGTPILYGASSGYSNTKSASWSLGAKYAWMDVRVGSNFGSGASNCRCNITEGCEPKGKYGWILRVNAAGHTVKIWDVGANCSTNRAPDWTIAVGTSKTFGTGTCDPNSGAMRLWDSVEYRFAMNFEG